MGILPAEIGPYRVTRKLGEGGMGEVYDATHQVIRRRVAIKVLRPEMGRSPEVINRFINEARAANLISHPGLVQITDLGSRPDGAGYLVMEYLQGETLAARLEARGGKLAPEEAVHIAAQLASALVACHKGGIVHRDLKPGNVMLVPDPAMATGERTKVLDFGLAKLIEVREAALVQTQSQAVLGTPLYMSPEQCEGAGRVDAKTDVYALGCMLFELLTGRTPFRGDGAGQVIGQHLFKAPEPLATAMPGLPSALCDLVDRLLIKDREERPSMRDAQRALDALAESLPSPPRRAPDPSGGVDADALLAMGLASTLGGGIGQAAGRKAGRRSRGLVVGGVALVGAMTAGGLWTVRGLSAPSVAPTSAVPGASAALPSAGPGPASVAGTGETAGSEHARAPVAGEPGSAAAGAADPASDHTRVASGGAASGKRPVLGRIAAPIKKIAGKIAGKFKKKPAAKPATKSTGKSAK